MTTIQLAVNYTPATSVQLANYQLIASGNAFDTSPVTYAASLQDTVSALSSVVAAISTVDASIPTSINSASTTIANLVDHLKDQYTNLVDNLSLVTSAISDAIGYGIIGTPGAPAGSVNNPTASIPSYFGSIMGSSNSYVAQGANMVSGIAAQAATLLAGGCIATILSASGVGFDVTTALGPLTTTSALSAIMSTVNATNLTQLSSVMSALATVSSEADFGSAWTAITSQTNLALIAGSLGLLGYLAGLGNLASSGNISSLGASLSYLSGAVGAMQIALIGITQEGA